MSGRGSNGVPRRSPWLYERFRKYALRYVGQRKRAVRIAKSGPVPPLPEGPLIVVLNHPSWWDPMVGLVVASKMLDRHHFAPIDNKGLLQYPFLERLGFFGIDPGTSAGARAFLRQGLAILGDPKAVIWLTAQGKFVDPRERPVRIKEGVGHLVHRLKRATIWVMAFEYPFWEERTPEALLRFAPAIVVEDGETQSAAAWTLQIETALEANQDALAIDAIARDPSRFDVLLIGKAGVGGVYDLWRRAKAFLKGQAFAVDHGARLVENEDLKI